MIIYLQDELDQHIGQVELEPEHDLTHLLDQVGQVSSRVQEQGKFILLYQGLELTDVKILSYGDHLILKEIYSLIDWDRIRYTIYNWDETAFSLTSPYLLTADDSDWDDGYIEDILDSINSINESDWGPCQFRDINQLEYGTIPNRWGLDFGAAHRGMKTLEVQEMIWQSRNRNCCDQIGIFVCDEDALFALQLGPMYLITSSLFSNGEWSINMNKCRLDRQTSEGHQMLPNPMGKEYDQLTARQLVEYVYEIVLNALERERRRDYSYPTKWYFKLERDEKNRTIVSPAM